MDLATRFTRLTTACLMFVLLSGGRPDQGAANVGTTTRVSVDSMGTQANNMSFRPALSADGRFVAFGSAADNLVAGDTNEDFDIFVHDRHTGTTTRVSVDSSGIQGNGASLNPALSADGRFVAFSSFADNLVPNDTNEEDDIFVHQLSPAAIVNDLVSLSPDVATAVDATPVPGGPAGTFTITATFTNTSPTGITTPFFQVSELSGGNLLVNADGDRTITGANIGATLTPDVGDDVLSPGESVTTVFIIGLTTTAPFRFFVNALGVPNP